MQSGKEPLQKTSLLIRIRHVRGRAAFFASTAVFLPSEQPDFRDCAAAGRKLARACDGNFSVSARL